LDQPAIELKGERPRSGERSKKQHSGGGSRKSSRQNQRYRTRPAPAEEVGLGLQQRLHHPAAQMAEGPRSRREAHPKPLRPGIYAAAPEPRSTWNSRSGADKEMDPDCRDVSTSRRLSWPMSTASRTGSPKALRPWIYAAATEHVPRGTPVREEMDSDCRDVSRGRRLSWPMSTASRTGSQKAPSEESTPHRADHAPRGTPTPPQPKRLDSD